MTTVHSTSKEAQKNNTVGISFHSKKSRLEYQEKA